MQLLRPVPWGGGEVDVPGDAHVGGGAGTEREPDAGDGGRNGPAGVAGRRVRLAGGQADQEVDLPLITRSELVRSLRTLD